MKHNAVIRSGFMLIELIVATLIASLVAGVLLTALNLGGRSRTTIDTAIDMSERVAIVTNQLEKDLMGAFIPVQAEKQDEKKNAAEETAEKPDDKKKSSSANTPADTTAEKQPPKPIEKIFYSTNKDGMLDTLTFITNDPLVVFVGKDVGEAKPKVARVQYTLRPEPEKKDSYVLFRQESKELDLAEYKNVRPYEVIGGIKRCTVKFIARIEKKSEEKSTEKTGDKSPENKKISYEYKELPEWVSEPKKESSSAEAEKDKKPEFPRIPYRIEFKFTLWDKQDQRDKDFVMSFEIPVDFTAPKKEEKKQFEAPKKDEKPAPSGGKVNQQQGKEQSGQQVAIIENLSTTLSNLTKFFRQM
jgi:type II secretory pathway component PulJ